MSNPGPFEKRMRLAILIGLVMLVIVAPLVGVYGLSPFVFAWGLLAPYQLAVAVSVMFAQAIAIATVAFLIIRSRK
jgi:hypothetical protein